MSNRQMSNCDFCLSREVCKYNDGHNLWCKGECPKYKNEYVYKKCFCEPNDKLYYISAAGNVIENKVYYLGTYVRMMCYQENGKPLLDTFVLDTDINDNTFYSKEDALAH